MRNQVQDDDDDDDPYIQKKKFKKETARLSEELKTVTKSQIQQAIQEAIQREREESWIKQNSDFIETMKHAEKLVLEYPDLAESILKMPDNFERQKLVYNTIKNLRLDKPKQDSSIQDKIDANRRGAHYQPSGVGTGSYSMQGDFSLSGQKAAYEKIQQLKSQLRL
jgi:ERCC4-related helicase